MKDTLSIICRLCFTPEGEGLLFQRFIIMSFNIIKQVLLCPEYKLPKNADLEDLNGSPSMQGHTNKTEFFQPSTVMEIAKYLISQYLLLSKEDLELWDADPEQYGMPFLSLFDPILSIGSVGSVLTCVHFWWEF